MTDPKPPSPPSPPVPPIPVAAHVTSRHAPEWGKGIVTGKEGKLVRVLFVSHPAKKQVLVPPASLVVEHVSTWPDPSKQVEVVATPSKGAAGKKKVVADPAAEPTPVDAPAAEPTTDETPSSS